MSVEDLEEMKEVKLAEVSEEDARNAVLAAQEFIAAIKALTEYVPNKS
jgi:hypothetical protein